MVIIIIDYYSFNYSCLLCGVLKGALEMVSIIIDY